MKTFDVYNGKGKKIDTVFFDNTCSKDYVKISLINHDGYPNNIRIIER